MTSTGLAIFNTAPCSNVGPNIISLRAQRKFLESSQLKAYAFPSLHGN